jgi:hypothetical protein
MEVMHQIFRVEHRVTLKGPFQTNDAYTQRLAKMTEVNPRLKFPGDDGLPLGNVPFSFVFGCRDLDTLRIWFLLGDSDLENKRIAKKLSSLGFHVGEYLVDDDDCWMSSSGIQVAFNAFRCREDGLVTYHDMSILSPMVDVTQPMAA